MNQTLSNLVKEVLIDNITKYFKIYCFAIDCEGNYLYKNESLKELTGNQDNAATIDSKSWQSCLEVIKSGENQIIEEQYQDYWFLSVKTPFITNNQIIGVIGMAIDITKEKQAERVKEDFLSNMQHDLRTPFSGISGIANMLYLDEQDSEKRALLEIMLTSCSQWEAIQHRIFDALSLRKKEVVVESFNLFAEVRQIEQMMAATLALKKLKMIVDCSPSIASATLTSDRLKVQLMLLSLISNAINFTEKGQITIQLQQQANQFIIKIADTGIGIPTDKLNYIFEQFTKLSRSNEHGSDFKGAGVGLYICRQYAESLNGQIMVESTVGKGSIFTLTLPQLPLTAL